MSSSSSSDSEARGDKGKGESKDWAWFHCRKVIGAKNRVLIECNYCKRTIGGGGITRFKHHIVGGDPNVKICSKVDKTVKEDFKNAMKAKKEKQKQVEQAERMYVDTLFEKKGTGSSEESDDDIVYPQWCESAYDRRQFRRALRDNRKQYWEDEQRRRYEGPGGASGHGGGAGALLPPTKRTRGTLEGMWANPRVPRSQSMRFADPVPDPVEDRLRAGNDPGLRPKPKQKQSLLSKWWKAGSDGASLVGRAAAKLLAAHNIAPHIASEPYLQHFATVCGEVGPQAKVPSAWELMNKYIPAEMEEVKEWMETQKRLWPENGVTLMCDGWSSGTRRQIINFLAYCRGTTMFLGSVDASGNIKDADYIKGLILKYMKEIGIENVVQIVTDNGSNFKKAGLSIMNSYPVFWTPCAAHCIDLMLKDMAKIPEIESTVTEARTITRFIYNHSILLNAMRRKEYCGGDLIRPGVTRFATNFLALQSLQSKKSGLRLLFNGPEWNNMKQRNSKSGKLVDDLVNDKRFWERVTRLIKIMEPIVKCLRLVDGDKAPTMPWVYQMMQKMEIRVLELAPTQSARDKYAKIIKKRWHKMLMHPLHKAGYYFNPRTQYSENLGFNSEIVSGLKQVIDKLVTSSAERIAIMDQLRHFREATSCFGHPNAIADRAAADPVEWWTYHGTSCHELRKIAVRILSQTAAAGGCERNWSTFNLVHSKRRNRLGVERLNNLVFLHYNMRLKAKNQRHASFKEVDLAGIHDPIDTAFTFCEVTGKDNPLQDWMLEVGAPLMDDGQGQCMPDPVIVEVYDEPEAAAQEAQQQSIPPPRRLEEESEHVATEERIERNVERIVSSSSSSTSSGESGDRSHSTSKSKTEKSDDDDSSDAGGKFSDIAPPQDDDDRPYLYQDGRERTVVAPRDNEPPAIQNVFSRRKTRGNKEFTGTTTGAPDFPQYHSDAVSDMIESMGSMSVSDEQSSSFGDQLFGTYQQPQHYGYEPYGYGYGYGSSSATPAPPPPPQQDVSYTYAYGTYGVLQDPFGGVYSYSSASYSGDGGQTWYGGSQTIPLVQPLPQQPQLVIPPSASGAPTTRSYRECEELEPYYPRVGMMQFVNPSIYKEHIDTYNKRYKGQMSWETYVDRINQHLYGTAPQPPRHSSYN